MTYNCHLAAWSRGIQKLWNPPKSKCTLYQIISPITGRKYNAIGCCSCKTNNIIYCITCQVCLKQYIGHTKRTLSERMCEHFRYITQHNSTHSVGRHFNMEEHQGLGNVKLHVLQFGRKDPDFKESLEIRLEIECLGIHRLSLTTPMGLNVFDWEHLLRPTSPDYLFTCLPQSFKWLVVSTAWEVPRN